MSVATVVQLLFIIDYRSTALTEALETKAKPVVELAAHQMAAALELDDREQMTRQLNGLIKDPDVQYAALFDNKGALVSQVGNPGGIGSVEPLVTEQPTARHVGGILRIDAPVASTKSKATLVAAFGFATAVKAERDALLLRTVLIAVVIGLFGAGIGVLYGGALGRRLRRIAVESERIAQGDLSRPLLQDTRRDEIGRMARAFDRMVASQRELVRQMNETVLQLNTTAGQFRATAQQQERGSTEQSSAVEETNRTLTSLLASAREIAGAAQGVTLYAERTQENTSAMAKRIGELSRQVERITEILELIKGIASKSEILALNAALEGSRAGEAGRGFSLVASQMQRLAENVMEAVRDIRNLTDSIRDASQSSVIATEDSINLSSDTTRSARQIALIIEQQQSATEQVASAMTDVGYVATQTASASKDIVASTDDILQLCGRLRNLVSRFTVDHRQAAAKPERPSADEAESHAGAAPPAA
ncbi:MAG TPA: methyl-accepting chemotaxis protein [Kofleriaceae bacterium]